MTAAQSQLTSLRKGKAGKDTTDRIVRSYWIRVFEKYEESGLKVPDFCSQSNISKSNFYKWRKILKGEISTPSTPQDRFIPVEVSSPDADLQKRPPESSTGTLQKKEGEEPACDFAPTLPSNLTSSGVSLHLKNSLKIILDKEFHGPTLQHLLHFLSGEGNVTC